MTEAASKLAFLPRLAGRVLGAALTLAAATAALLAAAGVLPATQGLAASVGVPTAAFELAAARTPAESPVPALEAALAVSPADYRLYQALGRVRTVRGETEAALRLYRAAASLSGHAGPAHTILLQRALIRHDMEAAARHIDILLRTNVAAQASIFQLASTAGWPPSLVKALASRMARGVAWRAALIALSVSWPDFPALTKAFADALDATGERLTVAELTPALDRLTASGRYAEAHALWLDTRPPEERAARPAITNPSFASEPDGSIFDWRAPGGAGIMIRFAALLPPDGPALTIDAVRGRRTHDLVSQVLMLEPGRWTISGRVRADGIVAARGLRWSVACITNTANVYGRSKSFLGREAWADFSFEIDVAPDCPALWMGLAADAPTPADADFEGRVAFTGFTATRAR
jgi:hypothetical protein